MNQTIQYFSRNTLGRDFVVGDLHGMFHLLDAALEHLSFNSACDRLFCVGDLIDRGPFSSNVLEYLPRIHSVLGNHEDMLLSLYDYNIETHISECDLKNNTSGQGKSWWMDIDTTTRIQILLAFQSLPLVIEIDTPEGPVGIIHGSVPLKMTWSDFKSKIISLDPWVRDCALWSRSRIRSNDSSGVEGVFRIFSGHTIVENHATILGNVYFIDTGAFCYKTPEYQFEGGHLTIANILASTKKFKKDFCHTELGFSLRY